jgi:hypothetical protein
MTRVDVGLLSHQESFAKRRTSTFSMFIQNLSILRDRHFSLYPSFSSIADNFRLESLLEPNSTRNSFSLLRCLPISSELDALGMLVNVSDRQLQKRHPSAARWILLNDRLRMEILQTHEELMTENIFPEHPFSRLMCLRVVCWLLVVFFVDSSNNLSLLFVSISRSKNNKSKQSQ